MRTRIEFLTAELKRAIDSSTKKIELLDIIRARDGKEATTEELDRLIKKESGVDHFEMRAFSEDIVSLMLEAKASKREKKGGEKYKPFLINTDLSKFEFQYKISELIAKKEPFHYDCIIMTDVHCSPMQIDSNGEDVRVFYIDAAGDQRNVSYAKSLAIGPRASFISHEGGIQYDHVSCSIFSIQHLNNLSHTSFKTEGKDLPSWREPAIMSLTPLFLKNIQSTSSLQDYYSKKIDQTVDKKHLKTLEDHIDEYSITVDIADSAEALSKKTRTVNFSIAYKTHKYLLAALDKLNEIQDADLDVEAVIRSRNTFNDKDTRTEEVDQTLRSRMLSSFVEKKDISNIQEFIRVALRTNEPELILNLMDAGAKLNIAVPYDKTDTSPLFSPIQWAIQNDHDVLVKRLLDSHEYPENTDCRGQSLIEMFTERMHPLSDIKLSILRDLIENGANINEKLGNGSFLISRAVREKASSDMTKHLIELGAKIDVVDNNGNTPLHCVQNIKAAEALIRAGGSLASLSNNGQTPLHNVTIEEIAKLMILNHAEVNKKDKDGKTPLDVVLSSYSHALHYDRGSLNGMAGTISILIENGANDSFLTTDGQKDIISVLRNQYSLPEYWRDKRLCTNLFNALSAHALSSFLIANDPMYFQEALILCGPEKLADTLNTLPNADLNKLWSAIETTDILRFAAYHDHERFIAIVQSLPNDLQSEVLNSRDSSGIFLWVRIIHNDSLFAQIQAPLRSVLSEISSQALLYARRKYGSTRASHVHKENDNRPIKIADVNRLLYELSTQEGLTDKQRFQYAESYWKLRDFIKREDQFSDESIGELKGILQSFSPTDAHLYECKSDCQKLAKDARVNDGELMNEIHVVDDLLDQMISEVGLMEDEKKQLLDYYDEFKIVLMKCEDSLETEANLKTLKTIHAAIDKLIPVKQAIQTTLLLTELNNQYLRPADVDVSALRQGFKRMSTSELQIENDRLSLATQKLIQHQAQNWLTKFPDAYEKKPPYRSPESLFLGILHWMERLESFQSLNEGHQERLDEYTQCLRRIYFNSSPVTLASDQESDQKSVSEANSFLTLSLLKLSSFEGRALFFRDELPKIFQSKPPHEQIFFDKLFRLAWQDGQEKVVVRFIQEGKVVPTEAMLNSARKAGKTELMQVLNSAIYKMNTRSKETDPFSVQRGMKKEVEALRATAPGVKPAVSEIPASPNYQKR